MIKNKTVDIKVYTRNKKQYPLLNIGDIVTIDISELPLQSHIKITAICDICGKEKEIRYDYYNNNIKSNNIFACSKKCANIKRDLTNIKKYGCKNIFQHDEIKKNIEKQNIKKYGVSNLNKLETQKLKIKNTNLEKYGVSNSNKLETQKLKIKKTKFEKYGDEKYTNIKKLKETKLKKYGDENYINNEKRKKTCLLKYGEENYMNSTLYNEKRINNVLNKYKLKLIAVNYPIYTCFCDKCDNDFDIQINILIQRKLYKTELCTICNPVGSFSKSGYETQLFNFIKENNKNIIYSNVKNLISPLELDIYIPDLKLAFEFNGLYWHNEVTKNNNYHLNKTELCEQQGIQLIHIWEDDWLYKQDIVKSMILNKLNKTENKIFARKTEIKEIFDKNLVRNFLEINHIQGYVGSKFKIGLFYNNELVSLMIFGKRRIAMCKKTTNCDEYELIRFCNKLNTNIVGGSSKLFKYFIKNYNPQEITTYADRTFSQGKLYETLGFDFIGKTEPNYYYIIDGIKRHRFNYRKNMLVKQGFDPNKTEHEIMLDRKIYRIYDSGNLKYIYIKKDTN